MPHNSIQEVASYIGPMCLELRKLAVSANLIVLAYVLEIASLEATKVEADTPKQKNRKTRKRT